MISANIAALKAKLSSYLRRVRQGEEVVVLDRATPVAKVVPFAGARAALTIVGPSKSPHELKRMKIRPVKKSFDVVATLREERDRR